ncbi:hypothetical protein LZ198_01720 [Myxococcus sp. K15C18031901]|uniref:hypothetical protein n=1 Tax=Myxococcus dinghuensis TaxID=2906761 RepID=UPI0020A7B524|nr:hypothetical protein [Myxococcus dinghuensis]MCP3097588.1 hypothetical protein [Myxococcus dinghuensis]
MKVHLSFKAANDTQLVHLVSGEQWSGQFVRTGPYPPYFGAASEPEKDHYHVVEWDPSINSFAKWKDKKDVQWLDVPALKGTFVEARLAEIVARGCDVGTKSGWTNEDLVDVEPIHACFKELTGDALVAPMPLLQLCQLMLTRTARSLQFEAVYLKPYTTYEGAPDGESDVGYVRIREGESLITSEVVEGTLATLKSAKAWFHRQTFTQGPDGLVREHVEGSNPYRSGMVHFRVRGFVDQPDANPDELLFTYIHEMSHCWANARDNVGKDFPRRAMYIRRWVTGSESTTVARARADPALLLTSADFMAYTLLRRAGVIDPGFLERKGWRDS